MKSIRNILATLALAFLSTGCILYNYSEDEPETRDVSLQMSFTKADDLAETKLDGEGDQSIHSLKFYIFFIGESGTESRPAGYYEATAEDLNSDYIRMDMKMYRESKQNVRMYAIANEAAMVKPSVDLNSSTSEDDLKSLTYTGLTDPANNGLPLYAVVEKEFDLAEDKFEKYSDPHNGHDPDHSLEVHKDKTSFLLKQSVSKLTVHAAKESNETNTLEIKEVKLLQGSNTTAWLFEGNTISFTEAINSAKPLEARLTASSANCKALPDASADRKDTSNFTTVTKPVYLFENLNGSPLWSKYDIKADPGVLKLAIKYKFSNDSEKVGYVTLPQLVRGNHIEVNCLMTNSGQMTITLTVSAWDGSEEVWDYSETITVNDDGKAAWYSFTTTEASEEIQKPYTVNNSAEVIFPNYTDGVVHNPLICKFQISAPQAATWYATIVPVSGDFSAFAFAPGSKTSGPVGEPGEVRILTTNNNPDRNASEAILRIVVRTVDGRTIIVKNLLPSTYTENEFRLIQNN